MRAAFEHMTRRHIRAMALVVCLCPVAAGAEPLHLPTAPLQDYYAEQYSLHTESSEALARALLYTAQHAPRQRRLALLEQASLIDPTLPAPHMQRALLLVQRFDLPGATLALRDAVVAIRQDAVQSALWSLRLQSTLLRTLSGALVVMALLLFLRVLPFLDHRLGVRVRAPRALLLAVCAIVLFGLVRSPVPAALVLLAALSPLLMRAERTALALLCVLLGSLSLTLQWQRPDVLLADRGHRTALLARGNVETLPDRQVRELEARMPATPERDIVLGLQAARHQQWQKAHRYYVAAQSQDSTWAPTYINLANLFFALSDFERAATGYRTAQSLDPNDPTPHANLAQAYIQMLQYEQSDHELAMASSLGFDATSPRRRAWVHEDMPVFDALLTPADLRDVAVQAAQEDAAAVEQRLAVWRGPGWEGIRPAWMAWIAFAAAVWFMVRLRWSAIAFECAECRRMTCRHCARHGEEEGPLYCPRCEMLATRRSGATVGDGSPASRRPPRTQRLDEAPQGLALLFPGAAFLVLRAPRSGFVTVLCACAALSLLTTPWIAAAVFLTLYLPGLLRLRSTARSAGV
jgi:tetratricopeptide (TPR) repeat protein